MLTAITENRLETSKNHSDATLWPRHYAVSGIFKMAINIIEGWPHWRIVSQDPKTGIIRAERKTRLLRFIDDVEIQIVTNGETEVHVRSQSRIGKGDFGQNKRNVREFLMALDKRVRENRDDAMMEELRSTGFHQGLVGRLKRHVTTRWQR
jgi:uncharacterized protein (DUF1499 family)